MRSMSNLNIKKLIHLVESAKGEQKYFNIDFSSKEEALSFYDCFIEVKGDNPPLSFVTHLDLLYLDNYSLGTFLKKKEGLNWRVRGIINFKGESLKDDQEVYLDEQMDN